MNFCLLTFTASRVSMVSGCEMALDPVVDPEDAAAVLEAEEGCVEVKSILGLLWLPWAASAVTAEAAAIAAAALAGEIVAPEVEPPAKAVPLAASCRWAAAAISLK